MDVTVFSNREDRFIKQDELELFENDEIEDKDRKAEIKVLVDEDNCQVSPRCSSLSIA
jgi:hypothetical protein